MAVGGAEGVDDPSRTVICGRKEMCPRAEDILRLSCPSVAVLLALCSTGTRVFSVLREKVSHGSRRLGLQPHWGRMSLGKGEETQK